MLKAVQINKSFEKKQVLDGIDLTLESGHIFGLLGTNGAGKSTMLRLMAGILQPDRGEILLDGQKVYDNPSAKQFIFYLNDDPVFLHSATLQDMGRFNAAWYPQQDNAYLTELCRRFSLPMDEKLASFSKGTRKRAQVCLALSSRPKVLLCDETFDGLDPVMRESFRKVISEETWDRGMVTVLAGHNQQDMEDICDSVGFLHNGKLLTAGDMEDVVGRIFRLQFAASEPVADERLQALHPMRIQRQGRLCMLTLRGNQEEAMAKVRDFSPEFAEVIPLSLGEVFILEMEEQGYAEK